MPVVHHSLPFHHNDVLPTKAFAKTRSSSTLPVFVGSLTAYSFINKATKYIQAQLHPPASGGLTNLNVFEKVFYSAAVPGISIEAYMRRLVIHANCTSSAFIVALVLLDRFREKQPHLFLSQLNIHRLLITALMVAAKMTDDRSAKPRFFARVGGMPSFQEIIHLEASFLSLVQYQVFVSPSEYCEKLEQLESYQ